MVEYSKSWTKRGFDLCMQKKTVPYEDIDETSSVSIPQITSWRLLWTECNIVLLVEKLIVQKPYIEFRPNKDEEVL